VICNAQGKEFPASVPEYAPWPLVVTVCVKPLPFAHLAVTVPLVIAAPIAAVPEIVTLAMLLDDDELTTELDTDDATDDGALELVTTTMLLEEDDDEAGAELEDVLLEDALLVATLLAADEAMLLEATEELLDEDDVDFLSSSSSPKLQPTKSVANKIPVRGPMCLIKFPIVF
jgi:hypothetical protein